MKEEWRQQMRQKMADYGQPAPEVSWDEIEKAVAAKKQQAKTIAMWPRKIAAAAVVVLLTAGTGYYLLNREQTDITEETAETRLIEGTIKQEPVAPQKQETSDLPILVQTRRHVQQVIQEKKMEALSAIAVVEDSVEQLAQAVEEHSEVQEPKTQEAKTQDQPRKNSLPEAHPTIYLSDFKRSASSDKRLMAKVYLSNAMSGNSGYSFSGVVSQAYCASNKAYYDNDGLISVSFGDDVDIPMGEQNNTIDEYGSTTYVPAKEEADHHQPIHFGLLLRYALNDRWSIEGGLSYALLTSDFRISSEVLSYYEDIEQRLTYVGIPVNVSYLLWGSRRFNVYASLGGMAEKMVKGKRHAVDQRTKKEADASVSIHPLQFSVNGGLGAEFLFTDWLSLYAEPGVGYWFDNGSDVPTYYQDKPFSFNLNVGLRFTIK